MYLNSEDPRTATRIGVATTIATLAAALPLAGCGAHASGNGQDHTETFAFDSPHLEVVSDAAKVDVRTGPAGHVDVVEHRTAFGIGAEDPHWALGHNVLDLGQPCGNTITVGLCEISYTVTVPEGTNVDVRSSEGDVPD